MSNSIKEIVAGHRDDCRVESMTSVRDVLARISAKDLSAMAVMDAERIC